MIALKVKFTEAQQQAIEHEGEDILVSAAAGSGKTAVLSERVLRLLKKGVSIDSLVILTFTNKAASEMKERIRHKVKETPHLSNELEKIDAAQIKTFDSYALYLLKRYGYIKNISKDVAILEQNDALIIKQTLIERVFLDAFNEDNQAFINLLEQYTNKNDAMLKSYIIYFYDKMRYFKDQRRFEAMMRTPYFTASHFEGLFKQYEQEILTQVKRFENAINTLTKKAFTHEKTIDYLDKVLTTFTPLFQAKTYDDIHAFITNSPKFPRLPPGKKGTEPLLDDEKAFIQAYKKRRLDSPLTRLKEDTKASKAMHYEAYMSLSDYVSTIMNILTVFDKHYMEKQHAIERLDYASVAKTVLEIIEQNPHVKDDIALNIHEIMVDEYQDTNALQEAFLQLIKRDNLYMVGDIKQSIYRFRNAEPSIFANKYRAFKTSDKGEAIDLNLNFRSRSEVLFSINKVFEHLMDHEIGGLDYDDNQALKYGNKTYDTAYDQNSPYGLTIQTYDVERYEDNYDTSFTKSEAELMHIAFDIKDKVENNRMKTKAGDTLRPANYGDFSILIDKSTQFQNAKKIFDYCGVPLTVHRGISFMNHDEVMVSKSLLMFVYAINNPKAYQTMFSFAFMSVMRSFIGIEDDDLIVNMVLKLPKSFPSQDELLSLIDDPIKPYFLKAYKIGKTINERPLDHTLDAIYQAYDVYEKSVKLDNTELVVNRLTHLQNIAYQKANEGYTIKDFIEYFDEISENDLEIELAVNTEFSSDKVNLMTMHQSKGLEFPYVYIPHLFNTFQGGMRGSFEIDERLGVLLPHENEGEDKHFLFSLFRNTEKVLDVSERLRVLYVALSRAEEGVFIIMGEDDENYYTPNGVVDSIIRRNFNSFFSIFKSILGHFSTHKETLDIAKYKPHENYKRTNVAPHSKPDDAIDKQYEPPLEPPTIETPTSFSSGVSEMLSLESLQAIEQGNLLHDTLEMLDFFSPIEPQLKAMKLSDKDKQIVKGFFETDLIQSLSIEQVYKEYPFHYQKGNETFTGFIDLLMKTSDSYIIIDYKLKNIDKKEYITQVKGYIQTMKSLTNLNVYGYLYSILDQRFKAVGDE